MCYNGFVRSARFFPALVSHARPPRGPSNSSSIPAPISIDLLQAAGTNQLSFSVYSSKFRILSRSSTDYCQLITDLSSDLPRPCRGHCHPCLKSFSCNTYGSPASVANKRLTAWLNSLDATLTKNRGGASAPRRSDFSTFRCAVCIPGGVTGRGRSDVATCFESPACPVPCQGHCHPSRRQCYHSEET